jgi:hypothetical protein
MEDASQRLMQLARILSDARSSAAGSTPDPAEYRHRVGLQRIQHLTAQLDERAGRDIDGVDAVTMRLLLEDYANALAALRAAAGEDSNILERSAAALRTDQRRVNELAEQETRFVSTAPSGRQPASQNRDT